MIDFMFDESTFFSLKCICDTKTGKFHTLEDISRNNRKIFIEEFLSLISCNLSNHQIGIGNVENFFSLIASLKMKYKII